MKDVDLLKKENDRLKIENERLKIEMDRRRSAYFEQNERMVKEANIMREALREIVKAMLPPGCTPSQMLGYDRPWQLAAKALYGELN